MILVNGAAAAEVSALDRGLAYGDGVFRTLPARRGVPMHWQRHLAKLAHDCAALGLAVPDANLLAADIKTACGGTAYAAVKIIITRGPSRRGYRYRVDAAPTRVVIADTGVEPADRARLDGVRVRLCATRLAHQPALAGVKHLNRLENVLARAEWDDADVAEGLMCDVDGNVVAGTMTNVFMVSKGLLATPRLDLCGVAGVTRERVLEAATSLDVPCAVMTCTLKDVLRAEEVFVVNSLAGIWPVRELEGERREPGRVTRMLQASLEAEDDAQQA
jgi:4-amino-4-deoxychorismate lyase